MSTSDKYIQQVNLLRHSCSDLELALDGGGSVEPFLQRVKNGLKTVNMTLQQLHDEGAATDDDDTRYDDVRKQANVLLTRLNLPTA